jgi:hypothetical protein
MDYEEFLDIVYSKSEKDYGILAPPTTAQDGLNVLINHFLGDNWYVVNPLSTEQVNTEAVTQILIKYPNLKFWDKVKRFFRSII